LHISLLIFLHRFSQVMLCRVILFERSLKLACIQNSLSRQINFILIVSENASGLHFGKHLKLCKFSINKICKFCWRNKYLMLIINSFVHILIREHFNLKSEQLVGIYDFPLNNIKPLHLLKCFKCVDNSKCDIKCVDLDEDFSQMWISLKVGVDGYRLHIVTLK
jgi:hypothetical protein